MEEEQKEVSHSKSFIIFCVVMGVILGTPYAHKLFEKSDPPELEQLRILERTGASEERLCFAKTKLANAYLEAGDEEGFEEWDLNARLTC